MTLQSRKIAPFVQTVRDLLPAEDCRRVIDLAREQLEASGLLGEQRDGYRTSSGTWLSPNDLPGVVQNISDLVCEITGLPASHQESVQVLRYLPGEEYKPHHDFWHKDTDYYEEQMSRGGQRAWSVLIYLNEVEAGGGTRFPRLRLEVRPKTGLGLAWRNLRNGEPNQDSLHAGLPVEQGEKWVAVTWVREQPFT